MSLRHLERALEATFADSKVPEDDISAFLVKNTPIDASMSSRLHEELARLVSNKSELPAAFLQSLARLAPYILNLQHLNFWFAELVPIAVDSGGHNNAAVKYARQFLLAIMSGEPESDEHETQAKENAQSFIDAIREIYLGHGDRWLPPFTTGGATDGTEERKRFVRFNCRNLLLDVVSRNMEQVLVSLNNALVKPESRLDILKVLSEMASGRQSLKLFKIAKTPVLESLLKTLEYDDVEISLDIASTTLAMILPHIVDKVIPMLPRLFACFGRLCSWQPPDLDLFVPESSLTGSSASSSKRDTPKSAETSPAPQQRRPQAVKDGWLPLVHIIGESSPDNGRLPNLDPLFMFFYGIFPNNTLEFCRQASDYLKASSYQRPFTDYWDRFLIAQRAESLFSRFTLNPLLLAQTREQELDLTSPVWEQYKTPADVIMAGMNLHISDPLCDVPSPWARDDTTEDDTSEKSVNRDEDRLQELLFSHQSLFQDSLTQTARRPFLLSPAQQPHAQGPSGPSTAGAQRWHANNEISLAPQRLTLASRPASVRTAESTQTSPSLVSRNFKDTVSVPPSPLLSPKLGHQISHAATLPEATHSPLAPELDESKSESPVPTAERSLNPPSYNRARSHSQPLQPSLDPTRPPMPAPPSSSIAPQLAASGPGSTVSLGEGDNDHNLVTEYFVRELLLSRNELDFANFSKYIIERKLVKLQKKLSALDMTNIRLEYVAGNNRALVAKLRDLEAENHKAQRQARTLLRQRTAYETTLLDKNREFKAQLLAKDEQIEKVQEENHRLETEATQLVRDAHEREAKLAEMETLLAESRKQLDEQAEQNTEAAKDVDGTDEPPLRSGAATVASEHGSDESWELRYEQAVLELEGLRDEHMRGLAAQRAEVEQLRTKLRTAEQRMDSYQHTADFEKARTMLAEIQAAEVSRYDRLNAAHEDLLANYGNLERELAARRAHEEERMNELRAALMSAKPFTFQEGPDNKLESRVRGRGGVQKAVKRPSQV